jgi:TRAP-type C4-dicarboxylate transport system substrate-binding protein
MTIDRRSLVSGALAAPALIAASRLGSAAPARTLKLVHPFRTSSGDEGDMRDRLCRQFAAAVADRTGGELAVEIASDFTVRDTVGMFADLRKGAIDLSLYPISDAAKELPELDIGLMPGLVTSYRQGAAWKASPVSEKFAGLLADHGVIVLSFIWLAGGMASRVHPIVEPQDAKGLKIRSGHHQMDEVLHAVGAVTTPVRTNVLYASMQSGALDAAVTTSTSLMGFRLEEVARSLTTGRHRTYWYILAPLIMSRRTFDGLARPQQEALRTLGREVEGLAIAAASADDQKVAELYARHGVKVVDLDAGAVDKWRALARTTCWKHYAERTPLSAELLRLAAAIEIA